MTVTEFVEQGQPLAIADVLTEKAWEHLARSDEDREKHNDAGCRCPLCSSAPMIKEALEALQRKAGVR